MLEMVLVSDAGVPIGGVWIPSEMRKCCKPGSIRILSATPHDVPCRVEAHITGSMIRFECHGPIKRAPSSISFHLAGKARTSPRAWERHSRQQFTQNRKAFSKALP